MSCTIQQEVEVSQKLMEEFVLFGRPHASQS